MNVGSSDPLISLTDKDRTKYLIETVSADWNVSFNERQHMLVLKKNKEVIIRYNPYVNTFQCLKPSIGLQLVSFCYFVIVKYYKFIKF